MKRVVFIIALLGATQSSAQMNTGMDHAVAGSAFTGPGDVVSGASAFWGLRAYNASYASSHGKLANVCTPADTSCQDVPSDSSGNFNLGATSLTCNNSGSICTVKTLYDQSGASSCSGACDMTQGTIANRPILVVPGAANGCSTTAKYCMSTTGGGNQNLRPVGSLGSAIGPPYSISAVYNNPSRTADEYLFDTTGVAQEVVSGFGGANRYVLLSGSNIVATANDNVYHATQGVFNGATSDANVDGTPTTGTTAVTPSLQFQMILLNASGGGASFGGFSMEFGVWPVAFTSTNSSNMSSNQHSYWGF